MFSIEFNGYNSYKDLDLVVEHKPTVPSPEKNIVNIDVQGRNGTLTEDYRTYKDISISLNFGFKEKDNFEHKCRLIKYWLNNIENRKLILSSDIEVFYGVKYTKLNNIDRSIRNLGRFAVTFICEPFCYLKEGLEFIEITKNNFTIYNEGTFESEPVIKIYGSGDIKLTINKEIIELNNVQSYIELDSEAMECYKGTLNCNNKMVGEFPKLKIGENKTSWIGNVSKIEIKPKWRCL